MVRTEAPEAWLSPHNSNRGQQFRSKRADLKVTEGACPGPDLSAAYNDMSVVSHFHASRAESLVSGQNRRYKDKVVAYHCLHY